MLEWLASAHCVLAVSNLMQQPKLVKFVQVDVLDTTAAVQSARQDPKLTQPRHTVSTVPGDKSGPPTTVVATFVRLTQEWMRTPIVLPASRAQVAMWGF